MVLAIDTGNTVAIEQHFSPRQRQHISCQLSSREPRSPSGLLKDIGELVHEIDRNADGDLIGRGTKLFSRPFPVRVSCSYQRRRRPASHHPRDRSIMKALVCELCGGNELLKGGDGLFRCTHCGTKYTTEAARKLFIDNVVQIKAADYSVKVGVLQRYEGKHATSSSRTA